MVSRAHTLFDAEGTLTDEATAKRLGDLMAAFARFAKVFPDQFMVTERGRYFPDDSQDKGRLFQ